MYFIIGSMLGASVAVYGLTTELRKVLKSVQYWIKHGHFGSSFERQYVVGLSIGCWTDLVISAILSVLIATVLGLLIVLAWPVCIIAGTCVILIYALRQRELLRQVTENK